MIVVKTVVLSGLPTLAEALRRHGLAVIDDVDGFETTAIAARRLREGGSLAGCIVSDVRRPTVESWVTRQAKLGMPTVLVAGVAEPGTGFSDIGVPEIDLPATVAEILNAVDVDAAGLDHLVVVADDANDVTIRDLTASTASRADRDVGSGAVDVAARPVAPRSPGATGPSPSRHRSTGLALIDRTLPPPTTAPVSTVHPVTDTDLDDWLHQPTDSHRSDHERRRRASTTLFVAAGKGGVGKTSMVVSLAQYCAASGLSAVAIDMNRGQADLAGYLKAGYLKALPGETRRRPLATIVDAASRRPVSLDAALISPDTLNRARHGSTVAARFHAVLGPKGDANADPKIAGDDVYRAIIRQAAQRFDTTIVDTQTIEAHDISTLIDGVLAPMVIDRAAWVLGVMDASSVSVANLYRRFEALVHKGAAPDRLMVVFNRQGAPDESSFDVERATDAFNGLATVIGQIPFDWAVARAGNTGGFIADHPAAAPVLRAVLSRVTGLAVFDPIEDATINGRRRFWERWRRR